MICPGLELFQTKGELDASDGAVTGTEVDEVRGCIRANMRSRRRSPRWVVTAIGRYDEAIRSTPETTSKTTVLPAVTKIPEELDPSTGIRQPRAPFHDWGDPLMVREQLLPDGKFLAGETGHYQGPLV